MQRHRIIDGTFLEPWERCEIVGTTCQKYQHCAREGRGHTGTLTNM